MKFFGKDRFDTEKNQTDNNNMSIKKRLGNRIAHIGRKMTRGAANIFRIMKTHAHWGNKQLWGKREKGRPHLPTDKSSQHNHNHHK